MHGRSNSASTLGIYGQRNHHLRRERQARIRQGEIRVEKLLLDMHAINQQIAEQPQRHQPGKEMDFGVKHAVAPDKRFDARPHFADMPVELAGHARLIECYLPHRRTATDLQPP